MVSLFFPVAVSSCTSGIPRQIPSGSAAPLCPQGESSTGSRREPVPVNSSGRSPAFNRRGNEESVDFDSEHGIGSLVRCTALRRRLVGFRYEYLFWRESDCRPREPLLVFA